MIRTIAARSAFSLLLLVSFGCKETETITKTETVEVEVEVFPDCSPTHPVGQCAAGETCFDGACVADATLCSPTNLTGTCTSGKACFAGGCVLITALCSDDNPAGPCETGSVCFQGECANTADLCSSSNPTGLCAADQTCVDGLCADPVTPPVDPCTVAIYTEQPVIGVDTKSAITVGGLQFKDSSGDGQLQPYEDWRLPESCRAKDLVSRMSAPQKIGLMSEGSTIGSGTADGTVPQSTIDRIVNDHLRQGLMRFGSRSGPELAVYMNNIQKLCEAQPWGVPFVATGDPIHGFGLNVNATSGAQSLSASTVVSPWPYPMGLGAANDAALTRLYGDTVRREFAAMGFRWQLGPMADLATEPRWARWQNTFGDNAYHVAKHTAACIEGFQAVGNGGLKVGIAATMKHFPGAGPNQEGMDSHTRAGKWNVFPGGMFEYHQIPFQAAVDVGVAAVMPCYSIFKDQLEYSPDQTASAYSKGLITDYLKTTIGFDGMVTSDWGVIGSRAWGLESLTISERVARFLRAGSHQLGSDSYTLVQAALDQGVITEADLDPAAEKILEMSFKLGIFENPYVDPAATEARSAENRAAGFVAQKKAIVILKNGEHSSTSNQAPKYLPISGTRFVDANANTTADVGEYTCDTDADGVVEVYFDGVNEGLSGSDIMDDVLEPYDYSATGGPTALAVVSVASAADADIAIVRVSARKGTYFGLDYGVPLSFDGPFPGRQTDSNLPASIKDRNKIIDLLRVRDGYTDSTGTAIPAAKRSLKIILVVHMDRPAIVRPFLQGLNSLDETAAVPGSYPMVSVESNIRADGLGGVDGLLAEFGAFDRAVLDVLFNVNVPTEPTGYVYGAKLPTEIPASDVEVDAQLEDVPSDTWNPTYVGGTGLVY